MKIFPFRKMLLQINFLMFNISYVFYIVFYVNMFKICFKQGILHKQNTLFSLFHVYILRFKRTWPVLRTTGISVLKSCSISFCRRHSK